MSTAARKARKRQGIRFERAAKTVTPLAERASFEFMQIPVAAMELALRGGTVESVTVDLEHLRSARAIRAARRKSFGAQNGRVRP